MYSNKVFIITKNSILLLIACQGLMTEEIAKVPTNPQQKKIPTALVAFHIQRFYDK